MIAGLNLFSIRNNIQTEASFLDTAKKLKAAGYSYMQFSGAEFDSERIARVSKESGMPVYLTHVPFDRIVSDTEKLMEEHSLFGCKNIGLGMLMPDIIFDEARCKCELEKLERAAETMSKNGFTFFYHHHQFEFSRWSGGERPIDFIIKELPHIHFIADTYWLQYGGVNVAEFIPRLAGRAGCAHLKDYKIEFREKENGQKEFMPRFAPLGEGNMNFKEIVDALKAAGTQYYFVEQDDAVEYADPMAEVMRSIEYIKKEL